MTVAESVNKELAGGIKEFKQELSKVHITDDNDFCVPSVKFVFCTASFPLAGCSQ